MEVRIYGVRGSVPTPGPTTVRYGGNTVCVSVHLADGTRLFLDAGTGLRVYGTDLMAERYEGRLHLLLSHRHFDHIIGLPFFAPIYMQRTELVMHPVLITANERRRRRNHILDGIQTPLRIEDLPARITFADHGDGGGSVHDTSMPWRIGSARVRRIDLNHPGGAQGFHVEDEDGSSVCYLTDNELDPPGKPKSTPEELAAFAKGCSLLVADSQYLPEDLPMKRGWGHSTVPEVLQLGKLARPSCQLLFHHDPLRTDAALDAIGEQAAEFASEHCEGPVLPAAEGMRFEVSGAGVRRTDGDAAAEISKG